MIFFMRPILTAKKPGTTVATDTLKRVSDLLWPLRTWCEIFAAIATDRFLPILKTNGWLDFKENTGVEKSARAQAYDADRAPDQRVGGAVAELVRRGFARENGGVEGRARENSGPRRSMAATRRNFAGSVCGGKKRSPAIKRPEAHFHRLRSADGLEHGALRRAIARRGRLAPRADRGDGDGRRQDARGDIAALPQCAHRSRRASGYGQ